MRKTCETPGSNSVPGSARHALLQSSLCRLRKSPDRSQVARSCGRTAAVDCGQRCSNRYCFDPTTREHATVLTSTILHSLLVLSIVVVVLSRSKETEPHFTTELSISTSVVHKICAANATITSLTAHAHYKFLQLRVHSADALPSSSPVTVIPIVVCRCTRIPRRIACYCHTKKSLFSLYQRTLLTGFALSFRPH
ncbi:hypothetical protein J6590_037596 [Homalodisca vitripennis]|nr:hypothetical protein J6590_037596 [Homalodisca vitripennis]